MSGFRPALALSLLIAVCLPGAAGAVDQSAPQLPAAAPRPSDNPKLPEAQNEPEPTGQKDELPASGEAPVPEPSPTGDAAKDSASGAPEDAKKEDAAPLPSTVEEKPAPDPRDGAQEKQDPEAPTGPDRPAKAETPDEPKAESKPMPKLPAAMSAEDKACRDRLKVLGVKFGERPSQVDPAGCYLPFPVGISTLGNGVEIEPEATISCQTAETTARFVQDVVAPDFLKTFGSALASVEQQSGYVCRPRHGTRKLSEHAFGRAIDFGAFTLADGRRIAVEKTEDAKVAAAFDRLRKAACGPFKTVLGPGSDADHATHFHLDLAERRNGSTFCQ